MFLPPPPPIRNRFAALTIASISSFVTEKILKKIRIDK